MTKNRIRLNIMILLGVLLCVLWLVLSGHFNNLLLLGLGFSSVIITIFLYARMGLLFKKENFGKINSRCVPYLSWLAGEISKSNLQVSKLILSNELEINPVITRLEVPGATNLAASILANSITLTPGTVSVEIEKEYVYVHGLTKEIGDREGLNLFRDKVYRVTGLLK